MVRRLKENYDPNGFAVTGYLSPNNSGVYADRYFGENDWSKAESYAHDLLMQGLYVNIINFKNGSQLNIDPTEYQTYFDGDFDINNDIVNFKRGLHMESFNKPHVSKESVNHNTEEQELQEFLQWLKDENIKVANVADKLKTIYLQNEKDLDEASFYLQDRDYFKRLYDFGWHVAVLNKNLGRKLANTLKYESYITEMKLSQAQKLVTNNIEDMSLEELQQYRVQLLDAIRYSTGEYGDEESYRNGFYTLYQSAGSSTGYVPKDKFLTTNLRYKLSEVEKKLQSIYNADKYEVVYYDENTDEYVTVASFPTKRDANKYIKNEGDATMEIRKI
jgi:hypothetical protein